MKLIEGGIYRHYKNKDYFVIGTSTHSETKEKLVVYLALYGDYGLWVRPLKMFTEKVKLDGKSVPRFKFIKKNL